MPLEMPPRTTIIVMIRKTPVRTMAVTGSPTSPLNISLLCSAVISPERPPDKANQRYESVQPAITL